MPPLNVNVSISKRFIIDDTMKVILLRKHDWNEPKLNFQRKRVARSEKLKKWKPLYPRLVLLDLLMKRL